MSTHPAADKSDALYVRPLPFVRRPADRRIEVFSPKLGRRLSLTSYPAWQLWLALEANPAATVFCERPALIEGAPRRTIDFWVRSGRQARDEFWLLDDIDQDGDASESSNASAEATQRALPDQVRGIPLRVISRRSLRTWSTPVANWAQLVPHLVTWRRFSDPVLAQSIVVFLGQLRTLDEIMERFGDRDPAMTEAALYSLVANGRVLSPDLALAPLSGLTRFRRA